MLAEKNRNAAANAEATNSLLRKLRTKDEQLVHQEERHNEETDKLEKEVQKLKRELSKAGQDLMVRVTC